MAKLSPLMNQYMEIKQQYPDSILFFRLGDFYEMFNEDARIASKELNLTLTSRRGKNAAERVPMCGVPFHAGDTYIARLIAKGYKVAICEQKGSANNRKDPMDREVLRVVTPGTVMDAATLNDTAGNFLCALYLDSKTSGLVFCDISTGEVHATGFSGSDRVEHTLNECGRFSPVEAVMNKSAFRDGRISSILQNRFHCRMEEKDVALDTARESIRRQFGEEGISRLEGKPATELAIGILLQYLHETQKTDLSYVHKFDYYEQGVFMELDLTARRNLELTETLRGREKRGSLLWVLDHTKTPMGARHLRGWLERPLLRVTDIRRRNSAVSALTQNTIARQELIAALAGMGDMERLISRISYGSANARDMTALCAAMRKIPPVKEQLSVFSDRTIKALNVEIDSLEDLTMRISSAIQDDPPLSIREGGIIRDGFDSEVDRLRHILRDGKSVITEMEAREKEKTNIRTLKIGYNRVFGYYIEVSNSFKNKVPDTYIRKQTLVNGERYITQELKELEHSILTASDRIAALEYEIFTRLREEAAAASERIQRTAAALGDVDALASLAMVAVTNRYCHPELDESGVIEIRQGRHPVVEQTLKEEPFVPNDTYMGEEQRRVAIITGPNMAGKSTYMRQVALIVLMAQIGSFVPADSAHIGIVDRVFTRIGASDNLSAGQSTFMVEMTEVADILHAATKRSLLILDEIGRGTSTYDGMSIARAVLERCADKKKLGARTLFATHYHELTELEKTLPSTINYSIAIKTRGDDIVFLRKILEGRADRSYGIEVAKLAGLPPTVIRRAKEILDELEKNALRNKIPPSDKNTDALETNQVSLTDTAGDEILAAIRRCHPENLTPIEAMELLYTWKKKLS